MGRALSSFAPSVLVLSLSMAGCGAPVKRAGYTVNSAGQPVNAAGQPLSPANQTASPAETSAPTSSARKASTPPPRRPTQEALYADVPEGGRLIGGPGPIALEDWGKGGHWIAHCSLQKGTKVSSRGQPNTTPALHLTLGDKSESIDAVLANEDSGRYLVALISGKAWLIDAVAQRRLELTPLNPDLRFDALPSHRSFAFTRNGLALLTGHEGKAGYFLPLSEKTDFSASVISWAHPIEFGARPVWRLAGHELSFSGATLPEDTTEKSWPVAPSSAPTLRCRSPSAPYPTFERASAYRPDRLLSHVWSLAPTAEQKVRSVQTVEAPGFVFGFRDGWVRREDSGRLLMVRGKTQEQIASERCGARVLHADEKSGLFLIACEEYTPIAPRTSSSTRKKPKYRFDLYLIRPGFVRSLKADTARTGIDHRGSEEQRLVPIRPGATAALVDFKKRALIPLSGELQVVLSSDSQAVLRRGNDLYLWSAQGEENIDLKVAPLDLLLTTNKTAAVGKTMLSLGDSLRTWELPGAPLAITDQGYALVPKQASQMGNWPVGPLLLLGPPSLETRSNGAKPSAP